MSLMRSMWAIFLIIGCISFFPDARADGLTPPGPCYGPAYGSGVTCPSGYSDDVTVARVQVLAQYNNGVGLKQFGIDSVTCSGNWYHTAVADEETCAIALHWWIGDDITGFMYTATVGNAVDRAIGCLANSSDVGNSQCKCNPGYAANTRDLDGVTTNGCFLTSETVMTTTNSCHVPHIGKPILPTLGTENYTQDTGLSMGGIELKFTYDSGQHAPLVNSTPYALGTDLPPKSGMLGEVWSVSLESNLMIYPLSFNARVTHGDGTFTNFVGDGKGNFTGAAGVPDLLTFIPGGYRYYNQADLSMTDFVSAKKVTLIDGRTLTYSSTSSSSGSTLQVQDNFGRSVLFNLALSGQLVSIVAPDGTTLTPAFSPSGYLSKITWPDSNSIIFNYENNSFAWAMTGVTDEANSRFATIGYDSLGRAVSETLAGGANAFQVSYPGNAPQIQVTDIMDSVNGVVQRTRQWVAPNAVSITLANGQESDMQSSAVLGIPQMNSQSQPAGSGCAASTNNQSFDANANLASNDDFNGNRRCYAYDITRNLRTVMLEGLPGGSTGKTCPANLVSYVPSPVDLLHPERKVSTVWHPDWALKAKEAEPKKITTWVYNGQPDPIAGGTASCITPATTLPDGKPLAVLCARYEQATTDATGGQGLLATVTGATRAWAYTYNQYGQTLTETTPKLSPTDGLSHTTTYAYYSTTSFTGSVGHTMGDLNTVTNPLLQVTTFTSYDQAGRLLSSKDANSTVTSMTYLPRGWLHTQTVTPASGSPLTTTYDYWPTGLLKTVTMPDTSTLNYAYDDAHRLTDITDAAANKIHYVLDNMGNRTGEQVTDASGLLASTVTRVFDQLNRVQSTTGAMH